MVDITHRRQELGRYSDDELFQVDTIFNGTRISTDICIDKNDVCCYNCDNYMKHGYGFKGECMITEKKKEAHYSCKRFIRGEY